jgi:hypothetical protein
MKYQDIRDHASHT